jgi:hypothetical protein
MKYDKLISNFDQGWTSGKAGIVYDTRGWNSSGGFNGRYPSRGDARMFVEDATLYSFGHHFPMAVRNDFGSGIRFVINGDRSSHTTNGHVQMCITQLKPNVQIPFSALGAAGIEPANIQIVAYTRDRQWYECAECRAVDSECECADSNPTWHHELGSVVFSSGGEFYLSSTDPQENAGRGYFLCKLPGEVGSVVEAFAVLKPDGVLRAEQFGREVRRQGDIFFVATEVTTRELVTAEAQTSNQIGLYTGRKVSIKRKPIPTEKRVRLLETSHVVSEAKQNAYLYVRGVVRHDPQGWNRTPEHKALRLGKATWWRVFKNTALGGWSAVGEID